MKICINCNLTKQLITFNYSINWWQCCAYDDSKSELWVHFAFFWTIHKPRYVINGEDGTERKGGHEVM